MTINGFYYCLQTQMIRTRCNPWCVIKVAENSPQLFGKTSCCSNLRYGPVIIIQIVDCIPFHGEALRYICFMVPADLGTAI
mmetsp:Transcript_23546/g.42840  ORF Transcript_23546/g.42840 Transcript_23546/m.42840 type:complete len:81 (+) Transcript_23546:1214-1456(+)